MTLKRCTSPMVLDFGNKINGQQEEKGEQRCSPFLIPLFLTVIAIVHLLHGGHYKQQRRK